MLGDAISGAKSLNDDKLADYIRNDHVQDHHGRHQVRQGRRVGEVAACCRCSITASSRATASTVSRGMDYQTVLTPADLKTGDVIYPYEKAK